VDDNDDEDGNDDDNDDHDKDDDDDDDDDDDNDSKDNDDYHSDYDNDDSDDNDDFSVNSCIHLCVHHSTCYRSASNHGGAWRGAGAGTGSIPFLYGTRSQSVGEVTLTINQSVNQSSC